MTSEVVASPPSVEGVEQSMTRLSSLGAKRRKKGAPIKVTQDDVRLYKVQQVEL